jgi:hypothetical protein
MMISSEKSKKNLLQCSFISHKYHISHHTESESVRFFLSWLFNEADSTMINEC